MAEGFKSTKTVFFLMAIACMAISVMSSRSTLELALDPIIAPNPIAALNITELVSEATTVPNPPADITQGIAKCWASLVSVQDCVVDIYKNFLGNRVPLGPPCCRSISNVTNDCWPKMFVGNPAFPGTLLQICNGTAPAGI